MVAVPATLTVLDLLVFLSLAVLLIPVFLKRSTRAGIAEFDRWAGMLALGAILQPLAWRHTYVLVFPLVARLLSQWPRMNPETRIWTALGVFGVGILNRGLFGGAGEWAELHGAKPLATLILLGVLTLSPSASSRSRR
jgi:hypothetical protein